MTSGHGALSSQPSQWHIAAGRTTQGTYCVDAAKVPSRRGVMAEESWQLVAPERYLHRKGKKSLMQLEKIDINVKNRIA